MRKIPPCIEVGRVRRLIAFERHLADNKRALDAFYRLRLPIPQVVLLQSRKQIDDFFGERTTSWTVGWARGRTIYQLSPEKYLKESSHTTQSTYWEVVKHEQVHLYTDASSGGKAPRWFSEGLSCYLAGQVHQTPTLKTLQLAFTKISDRNPNQYTVGYFLVKTLLRRYGRAKMLNLLHAIRLQRSRAGFSSIFHKIYGEKWNREFLEKITTTR